MRLAIYFTPSARNPLATAAAAWLGRDLFDPMADLDGAPAALVAEPRRYGFHATIKAPFRLRPPHAREEVEAALEAFAASRPPTSLGRLALTRMDGFFALVPADGASAANALADEIVRAFDHFRAPLTSAEIARRNPGRLTARQNAYLDEWGYPYVFDEFRLHMTLTGRVDDADAGRVEAELRQRFEPLLRDPVALDHLAIFIEPAPGADFRLAHLCRLTGTPGNI